MKSGEGKFLNRAIHFEKGTSPALSRLKIFEEFPTRKNLDEFIALSTQDFGKICGNGFESWSKLVFKDLTPVEDRKPIKKPFETQIKDSFYDCFRIARIPLEPKQIDALETATRRMANIFHEEMKGMVKDQLEVLVKKLNKPVVKKVSKKVPKKSPYDPSKRN
jgi:hypothetical protein